MKKWYVKDLSKLTGVSAQTLHHYDRIDLLKPSVRLSNGYRLYSENDLLKLQQIIALKFFGFELAQIKNLLTGQINIQENFSRQAQFLKEKAQTLLEASNTLSHILSHCNAEKSFPWETTLQLIELYRVTQELERTWAGKIFTSDEIKQYAQFKSTLKTGKTENKRENFLLAWGGFVQKVQLHTHENSDSEIALHLAKEGMDIINGLYGKEHAHIRHILWEKGIKTGKFEDAQLSIEAAHWLDQAFNTYYRKRILAILDAVGLQDSDALKIKWNRLMEEMYGNSQPLKQAIIDAGMTDNEVSEEARQWLIRHFS